MFFHRGLYYFIYIKIYTIQKHVHAYDVICCMHVYSERLFENKVYPVTPLTNAGVIAFWGVLKLFAKIFDKSVAMSLGRWYIIDTGKGE